jgi:hypothetical protein
VIVGGASVSRGLASAANLGIAVLLLLLAAGTAAFAIDRPLELAGRGIQWLLNATVRRDRHVVGLSQQLLADRDFIRTTLGGRWKPAVVAAANTGFDYLALLCALRAVGAAPPTLAGPARLHLRRPARAGAVYARLLGLCRGGAGRHAQARRCPGTAGADRDATVPAGRLLAADSRSMSAGSSVAVQLLVRRVTQPRRMPDA